MNDLCRRYLRLLGAGDTPTGFEGLRMLVRRHLEAVPFENISKLLLYNRARGGAVFTLSEYLDGIECSDLGGTCYTLNPFFAELLRELGYDAVLLFADMSKPNVHTCIRVRIGTAAYHVDVGFAAPFREPYALDRVPIQIYEGGQRYLFDRDESRDRFSMSMFSGSEHCYDYLVNETARTKEFLDQVARESFTASSTFLQCLRISRVFRGHSVDLADRKLSRHEAGRTAVVELKNMAELKAAVVDELKMPRCPVEDAIAVLESLTGRKFFV